MAVIKNSNIVLSSDIGSVLNTAGGSVNINQPATFFTADAKLNPWSKKKPVIRNVNFAQDFDSTKPDYFEGWWKAHDGKCGFTIPSHTTMNSVMDATTGGMNGWVYNIPNGSTTQPRRLGDFVGYDTNATPPFTDFKFPSVVTNVYGSSAEGSFLNNTIVTQGTSVEIGDLPALKDYYFGVMLYKPSTKYSTWNTMDTTIGNGQALKVTIDTTSLATGEDWVAVPFISTAKQKQSQTLVAATYYAFPSINKVTFKVISEVVTITIVARYFYTNNVKTKIIIDSITVLPNLYTEELTNNYVEARFVSSDFSDPLQDGETSIKISDFSVTKDEETTVPLTFAQKNITIDSSKDYNIWISLDTGKYKKWSNVLATSNPIL